MATDTAGIISEIQKVFGDNLKNPSTILNSFFEFLTKNDPEVLSIQKEFKRKYLVPLLKSWEKLSKDIDKNALKTSEIFNKMNNFFSSFEGDTKKIVNDNNKKFNTTLEEIRDLYLKKTEPSKKEYQPEIAEKKPLDEVSENKPLDEVSENKPKEKLIEENKKETIISFSAETNTTLLSLVNRIIKSQEENLQNINVQTKKAPSILDTILGLAKGLPLLFAAIGGASALAGMFWPEIKNYINEKFGDKAAEVFDKFQGTVNAIGKFISIGGLQVTVGKTFQTLGNLLGNVADDFAKGAIKIFGGIFDNLLGIGASSADDTAGKTIGKGLGSALKKGGFLLFKGLSKTALKAIPLIGSVISFADAWGRFKEGEYAQGIIDIGAGLAAFVPGVGIPLSIGLSVMNAIIDFKNPEEKKELIQKTFNIAGMLTKGVGVYAKLMGGPFLKRIPFIGSLFNFASAWEKFQQNNILGGTLDLASGIASFVPGVGLPVSIGLDILSSIIGTQEAKESGVQQTGFDFAKVSLKALKFFTNFGKPFFKRLFLLGSLLNFADAWDNFKNDNIMAGSLDLVSGIANLFPGVGTGLSIGIDFLNTFMSSKGEDGKTKFQKVGDWFSKIWKWLKETPIMKHFFNLYNGISSIFMGDVSGGLDSLSKIPVVGGLFKAIGEAMGIDTSVSQPPIETTSFSLETNRTKDIQKNLPTKYNKEEDDRLAKEAEDIMLKKQKLEDDIIKTKEQKVVGRGGTDTKNKKIEELNKQLENLMKEQSDLNIQITRQNELKEGKTFEDNIKEEKDSIEPQKEESTKKDVDLQRKLQSKVEELKILERTRNKSPIKVDRIKAVKKDIEDLTTAIHATDFSTDPSLKLPKDEKYFSYQPSKQTNFDSGKFVFLPKDEKITSYNSDGPINSTFKDLNKNIENLTLKMTNIANEISIMASKQQNTNNSQQPTIINNSNTTTSTNNSPNITSTRDENFLLRMDYIRNNSYNRVSY
jgi:hypothetical protein